MKELLDTDRVNFLVWRFVFFHLVSLRPLSPRSPQPIRSARLHQGCPGLVP